MIILSNLGQDRDVKQAMDTGAAAYLIKSNLSVLDLARHVQKALPGGRNS